MQSVHLICIGKLKESYLKEASAEYQKRLSSFCKLRILELPEYRLPDAPSEAEIQKGLLFEGKTILKNVSGELIALCIEGKEVSSMQLSDEISAAALRGISALSFVIGGSYGLSDEVKKNAALCLSMSAMTFPHQLARIMLLEQLYRSYQILSNGKYHK